MKSQSTTLATIVLSAMALAVLTFVDARASWVSDAPVAYPNPRSYFEAHVDLTQPEQARIRAHLASVEALLRTRSTDGLTDEQKRNRMARLNDLHAYREAGVFPRNLDFPDRLVPYFIDAAGTACAMGQLIIASGHADLAEDVRATMNNAYIAEIAAADPRLQEWVDEQGMTLEEAAMVQPAYGGPYPLPYIAGLGRGPDGKLWVLGVNNSFLGGGAPGLAYRDATGWKMDTTLYGAKTLCMRGNQPMLTIENSSYSFYWNRAVSSNGAALNGRSPFVCLWSASGDTLFAGTDRGLIRLNTQLSQTGAYDSLQFGTASRSVTTLTRTPSSLWVGTTKGLARGMRLGGGFNWSAWDSTQLGGKDVTGLVAGRGDTVWAGFDAWRSAGDLNRNVPYFSVKGIVRVTGGGAVAYRAGVLPSDSIWAVAAHPQGGVWFAADSSIYRFLPPSQVTRVTGIPKYPGSSPIQLDVTILLPDTATGGLFVGTENGLYHYGADSLRYLSYPTVSLRPGISKARTPAVSGPQVRLRAGSAGEASVINVQGRVVDPAAGVYVNRKAISLDTEAPVR